MGSTVSYLVVYLERWTYRVRMEGSGSQEGRRGWHSAIVLATTPVLNK